MHLNRLAAVRILAPGLRTGASAFRYFLEDVRKLAEVRHPNIVDVTGLHIVGKARRIALISEYVQGAGLSRLEGRRVSLDQVLGLALQVLTAVQAAHRLGVIHRGLGSSSVLLTRDPSSDPHMLPVVKLGGFGLASLAAPGSGRAERHGETEDVFSFSKIVFDLLWGVPALGSSVLLAVDVSNASSPRSAVALLTAARGEGVRGLAEIVQSGLAPVPRDRPALADFRDVMIRLCGAWVLHRLGLFAELPTLPLVGAYDRRSSGPTKPAALGACVRVEVTSAEVTSPEIAPLDIAPAEFEPAEFESAGVTRRVAAVRRPGRIRKHGALQGSFCSLRPFVPFLFSCALLALALTVVSR
ncbi:MAG: protein kinase [Deltaproteobacteria bacterium]|nr:protein kinase [Deltaproteobacteria bacterium]